MYGEVEGLPVSSHYLGKLVLDHGVAGGSEKDARHETVTDVHLPMVRVAAATDQTTAARRTPTRNVYRTGYSTGPRKNGVGRHAMWSGINGP